AQRAHGPLAARGPNRSAPSWMRIVRFARGAIGAPTQSLSDSGSGAGSGERVMAPAPVSRVRETAMSQGRRHVQTYIGVTDYARLQREAAARGATISKCAADCLREYFPLRT